MPEAAAAPESGASEPSFRQQVETAEKSDADSQARESSSEERESPADAEPPVEKTVPLKALHEARALTKAEKQARQQLERNFQAMQAQQMEMLAYIQAQQQPQRQMPDKTQDPLGYTIAQVEEMRRQQDQFAQNTMGVQQQQWQREQQVMAEHNFRETAKAANAEFATRQADANEGINYLKGQRVSQYEALGMTREQATQKMLADERELVTYCFQTGENPAERAYQMALTAGYTPAAKKLAMQRDGQGASLPGQGSSGAGGRLSLDALSKLKGEDFLKATAGGNWKKLMGGR